MQQRVSWVGLGWFVLCLGGCASAVESREDAIDLGGADSGEPWVDPGPEEPSPEQVVDSPPQDEEAQDGGSTALADGAAARDAAAEPECVRGTTAAAEVGMIGDSYFHITEIPQQLWSLARAAGALGSDETYRYYYVSGAMMTASTAISSIPTQYEQARTEATPLKAIIMSGGGNDVLIGDRSCLTEAPPANTSCAKTVTAAIDSGKTLFGEMAADGVTDVVYAFYPHMPTFGLFQGYAPAINETIDYAEAQARAFCEEETRLRCVFVSTVAAFEGHPEYINPNDVHASPAGSKVAAQLIWDAMVEHCIAQ